MSNKISIDESNFSRSGFQLNLEKIIEDDVELNEKDIEISTIKSMPKQNLTIDYPSGRITPERKSVKEEQQDSYKS